MKALFINIILFLSLHTGSYAQAIKGRVLDETTSLPLSGASIYINNTSFGTLSNSSGEFTISNAIDGELIVSSVGYERLIYKLKTEALEGKFLTFKLIRKQTALENVVVFPDAVRKKYLKLFVDNFLGITEEASQSRITNLNAIYFTKRPGDANAIIAMSDTPLHIINRKLGYNINFDLGEFYLNQKNGQTSFYGFTRYEEMGNKKKWTKNRRNAYRGSTLHFFRSLIANRLTEEHFSLYNVKEDSLKSVPGATNISVSNKMDIAIPIKATDIVKRDEQDSSLFKAQWKHKLMVQYHLKPSGKDYLAGKTFVTGALPNGFRSYLHLQSDFIRIDNFGLLEDPMAVFFSGYWIYEKAANLLPYNYYPEKE